MFVTKFVTVVTLYVMVLLQQNLNSFGSTKSTLKVKLRAILIFCPAVAQMRL